MSFVNKCGLHQFVNVPTRMSDSGQENILDLVFSNMYDTISDLSVIGPFSTSDHCIVKFEVNTVYDKSAGGSSDLYYDFRNVDFQSIGNFLANVNWLHEFSFVFNVNDYWDVFVS